MVEGLWSLEFTSAAGGPRITGWGMVVLQNGRVLGGDPCFSIVGKYNEAPNTKQVEATVDVKRFRSDPNYQSILGRGMDNYSLKLSGTGDQSEFTMQGQVVQSPQMKMTVTLRRQASG